MNPKQFVGRYTELSQIREWLQRQEGGLVLITGLGGIGKTSLLQKISNEYAAGDRFIVEYFDLAEQPLIMINLAVHLAKAIGWKKFPEFERKSTALAAQPSGLDQAYERQMDDAVDTFLWEVTAHLNACGEKLLLITDTFEIALRSNLYEDNRARDIYQRLISIPGTFFVVAGRDRADDSSVAEPVYPLMERLFGAANILHLPLSGFDTNETKHFFSEVDPDQMIPKAMREKLYILTNGRPILLSLAVEWLQRDIPLPQMIKNDLDELHTLVNSEGGKALLNDFKFELISGIRQLQTPLDVAILYTAYFRRRMEGRLLSVLLGISPEAADGIMAILLTYSFVKEIVGAEPPKCTLHDEMTVLVNNYAWPYLDRNGDERKRLAQKALDEYYLPSIATIKQEKQGRSQPGVQTTLIQDGQSMESDWKRWLLEAESVYYSAKISEEKGFDRFDQLFYDRESNPIRDQFLLDELRRADLDVEKKALREADNYRRRHEFQKAKQICTAVLQKGGLDDEEKIQGYTTLGIIDLESNPLEAEKNFQKALQLAISRENIRSQFFLHNNLGRLYRNISQLERSITHFRQARELTRKLEGGESIAPALNNLAWTLRLNGELDEADALCRVAIADNRNRGLLGPLAYSYLTKADIDRDRGDLQNAEKHAKLALDFFNRFEIEKRIRDIDGEAQAYRTMANISRSLRDFEKALRYLRTGIMLVERGNSPRLLASLYQLYGRTYRHYGHFLQQNPQDMPEELVDKGHSALFTDALIALETSIRLAEQIPSPWEVARSQLEIVQISMLRDESYDEARVRELLDQVWETVSKLDDHILMGYVYENRARVEIRKGRYGDAGKAFGEFAYLVSHRTGQEVTRAFSRLNDVLLDEPMTVDQRGELAKGLLEGLSQHPDVDSPALIALKSILQQPV